MAIEAVFEWGVTPMRMTLEEVKKRFPDRPKPAPLEFAGQWVAWNEDHTEIVAAVGH